MSRLCHIAKWDHFDGYGFDLHAEKGKPGQFIGKVDDGSPAQAAGLRQGDRIIEVNGANINGKTHRDVVELIKAIPKETKLLVISEDNSSTDGGSESKQKQIIENHTSNNNKTNGTSNLSGISTNGTNSTNSINTINTNGSEKSDNHNNHNDHPQENGNGTIIPPMSQGGGLNLNMTAAELRARLAAKKKFDPKKETTLDFKKKFDMIQKM
ncbi:Na(+)/H(+) exchange regulatory cofactor NHE-RF2 [Atheta coriaria]|uniref:Na(+)/H(+) exchange regulatory cofactor NHE-RF2 n=1 Tax=Dalotia coriaria TaxID=877792 RepID=UPI0031F40317